MDERTVGRTYPHLPLDAASSEHLPLHRLWAFAKLLVEFGPPEHAHILDCEPCRHALQACLRADHFGAVLKELTPEGGVEESEEGRPKLLFLYVVAGDRKPLT